MALPKTWVSSPSTEVLLGDDLNSNFQYLDTLAADLMKLIVPTGTILPFAGADVPSYFLLCDGSAVSRTTYSTLFAIIGTTWGVGDNSTTFNIPDLRSATLRGVGTSTIFTQNNAITLAQIINDQTQSHLHTTNITGHSAYAGNIPGGGNGYVASDGAPTISSPSVDGANGIPRVGNETTGKARGVNFIIKI